LLKFKLEQYTSQLKVMPLNFQPHMTVEQYSTRVLCLVSCAKSTGSLDLGNRTFVCKLHSARRLNPE